MFIFRFKKLYFKIFSQILNLINLFFRDVFVRTETGLPTDPSVQSLSDIAASKPVLTITESVGKCS